MSQGKKFTNAQKEKIIRSLKKYFKLGYSRNKACELAGFPTSTLQDWTDEDEALRIKINAWQGEPSVAARTVVVASINDGAKDDSKWWLERKERDEFSPKKTVEHQGGVTIEDLLDEEEAEEEANPTL